MIKELEIAVNRTQLNTIKKEVELPESDKYYSKTDDGRFFPEGLILFAVLLKHPNSVTSYTLIRVTRNKQEYNDFVPTKDCRQDYWLNNSCSLRKQAFDLWTDPIGCKDGFKEITKEEFEKQRMELLNKYQEK